jgi:hypothetical protein
VQVVLDEFAVLNEDQRLAFEDTPCPLRLEAEPGREDGS